MSKVTKGSCGCGAISYRVDGELRDVLACHCTQCRKQSGNYFTATNASDEDLSVTDGENLLTWYQSSDDAKRGFCSRCGSALFWKKDSDPFTSILAGSIDGPTGLKIREHIFCEDKGDYYEIG